MFGAIRSTEDSNRLVTHAVLLKQSRFHRTAVAHRLLI
jgi:hypothetical protein